MHSKLCSEKVLLQIFLKKNGATNTGKLTRTETEFSFQYSILEIARYLPEYGEFNRDFVYIFIYLRAFLYRIPCYVTFTM